MPAKITVRLARHKTDYEAAFRLLQERRERFGWEKSEPGKLWLLKHHALPSTNTIVALQDGQVVGAICLFGESPFHLPVEGHLDLRAFRKNLDGRLAELSVPGFHPHHAHDMSLLHALYHFAVCFGASYCHYEGMVMEAPLPCADKFCERLHFEKIYEPIDGRQLFFLNVREAPDFRAGVTAEPPPEYHFPEKKFFLVAHQSMSPETLHHLFNVHTPLFSALTDYDLRVLRNVYDHGDYAAVLPRRTIAMPEKKTPRFPRYPMNCEGFLVNPRGTQEHVQIFDVSREGLKVRLPLPPRVGDCYALTLFVGLNRKTELIASAVWVDETAGISGFEIKSSDQVWKQLLEYLEKDFLKVA